MSKSYVIESIDTHTAGNPTRSLISGFPELIGNNMSEKLEYVKENLDWIRTSTMWEPRGHSSMSGAIFTEPHNEEANMGVIFIDASGYLPMCGHSTIGCVTAMVENGLVAAFEPVTKVTLDTPAGLIKAVAHVDKGIVTSVSFKNIPSFLFASEEVELPEGVRVKVDVAYGGNSYGIVEAAAAGVSISPGNIGELTKKAKEVQDAINSKIKFVHPEKPFIQGVTHIQFFASPSKHEANYKNAVIMPPTTVDRSPCGTGTSARIAALYSQGLLKMNEEFVHESIIGSLFRAKVIEETKVGSYSAVIPQITGVAYITSKAQFVISNEDPFKEGFLLR